MEPQTLSAYITEQIRSGKTKQGVVEQLVAVGWSEDDANTAYAKTLIEMGVPRPEAGGKGVYAKKSSTVEVVLNLFSFILLGIITTALGTLYFSIIEHFFKDPITPYYSYSGTTNAIHYAMAGLIIGFPLFVFAVRMWFKKFREEENKTESALTKWVTYLVLLIAAVVIVGDLITVLYTFLQGEISIRFFLKGLTVLAIAGSIFGFYFLERKRIQYHTDIPQKTFQMFGWSLLGVILVGIALGFVATGSPQTERMRTFDTNRSNDLSELAYCVNDFAQQFERLPVSLDELSSVGTLSYCANKRDPETNERYEYTLVTPLENKQNVLQGTFEVCATFSLASDKKENARFADYVDTMGSKWYIHTTGRTCFEEIVGVKPTGEARTQDTLIVK